MIWGRIFVASRVLNILDKFRSEGYNKANQQENSYNFVLFVFAAIFIIIFVTEYTATIAASVNWES